MITMAVNGIETLAGFKAVASATKALELVDCQRVQIQVIGSDGAILDTLNRRAVLLYKKTKPGIELQQYIASWLEIKHTVYSINIEIQ